MMTKLEEQEKNIFEWGDKFFDVNELAHIINQVTHDYGQELMRRCLEDADEKLSQQRDKKVYRDKGYRKTTIKTEFGEVTYSRHVYAVITGENAPSSTVYLLDKSMGCSKVGLFSDAVCLMAAEAACHKSYRVVASEMNAMTGLNISHESVWRMVQSAGTWARNRADGLSAAAKEESSAGTYATDILYEEMDGVYLSLQGKDRQENGPSKEMKVSIAYSGVCEDASGRRTLANKVSYAGFEPVREFRSHAEGVLADFYDVDSIQQRIFNSDGGAWLQKNMVPGCIYQLDTYHRNKAVRTYVNDPDLQRTILTLLQEKRIPDALEVIEASVESTLDPAEQEKRRRLFSYFKNNRQSLIPHYERDGKKLPAPNDGQKPANCGSMESNIFTIIGSRMKHNRTSWSINGANHLASLLALHHTGQLRKVLRHWTPGGSPALSYMVTAPISAAQSNGHSADKDYIPPHTVSATDLTNAAKKMMGFWPASQLRPI